MESEAEGGTKRVQKGRKEGVKERIGQFFSPICLRG